MSFSLTLPWKFHFFFNWPLEFPCSSIPLEIPCLFHPCYLFGLVFFWNSSLLLVCIHIELGSHLKQVTTVLLSSFWTGSSILKTAYIGRLTFLLPFSRQEIHEKSTKNEGFQCAITQVVLVKNSWKKKVNTNLIFTLPSKSLIFIIDHAEGCFFLPLLNPLFHYSNLQRVLNWPCTSQKTVWRTKTCFSCKINDQIILLELKAC